MNLLQNHNVKLESENYLLRREIKNLHRQLYPEYNPNHAPQNHQKQPFRPNPPIISKESTNQKTQQPNPQLLKPLYESSLDAVNHPVDQNVTTYKTPSGVIKEVNYDHRNGFDLIKPHLTPQKVISN